MSIRSIIRAALAGIAKLVVVPVEMMINGVRVVMNVLRPARNTESFDEAAAVAAEEDASDVVAALNAAKASRAPTPRPSEPDRVRSAARDLRYGRDVSKLDFDPANPDEAEVATWLRSLDALHLGHLVNATDREIEEHLAGHACLPMPMLPFDEQRAEARREEKRPLDRHEWLLELMRRRAAEVGEVDEDEEDALRAQARELAAANATLEDYKPSPVRDERYDEAA